MFRCVAYTDARYANATTQAVGPGALVIVSPPASEQDFAVRRAQVEAAQLLYFNFHAAPGQNVWMNTAGGVALTGNVLRTFSLRRTVVFMVNCYAGGGMLDALREAQPRAIIGGYGENLGGLERLAGADLLGLWLRRMLALGLRPDTALDFAKQRLHLTAKTASVRDALEFQIL